MKIIEDFEEYEDFLRIRRFLKNKKILEKFSDYFFFEILENI
jgi:hypothetical protein